MTATPPHKESFRHSAPLISLRVPCPVRAEHSRNVCVTWTSLSDTPRPRAWSRAVVPRAGRAARLAGVGLLAERGPSPALPPRGWHCAPGARSILAPRASRALPFLLSLQSEWVSAPKSETGEREDFRRGTGRARRGECGGCRKGGIRRTCGYFCCYFSHLPSQTPDNQSAGWGGIRTPVTLR